MSVFLNDVISQTYYYSYYHSTDSFRAEYMARYGKQPYVIPYVRQRWEAGAAITAHQHAEGLRRLQVYRTWLLEQCFGGQKRTLMILPIANVEPNYRDTPVESPSYQSAVDELFVSPILGAPDMVLPSGEVAYQSRTSGREEFLPVAVNVVAAPGEDFCLLNAMREVHVKSGRDLEVCTGPRITPQRERMGKDDLR
ncbi:Uu.00g076600.m01.CDS01 [Anthostomella pinea]|uniref:Uu.00g076600.m01.CDS01 n=1 Tax=Anthostomella pinea TaxID=933095 RepID=A0AAI8YPA7_9PEZI|nr:Uu.00g076600.m01.CDS01 [Anthostomella pinea]